jgi:hypothetical protein
LPNSDTIILDRASDKTADGEAIYVSSAGGDDGVVADTTTEFVRCVTAPQITGIGTP